MRTSGMVVPLLAMAGCAARTTPVFRVVKPGPEFALESPAGKKKTEVIAFGKLMERQYGFTPGKGYVDLLPGMRITANRA